MMHYALSEGKCLSHHARRYSWCMTTPNERLKQIRAARYETAVEAAEAMGIKPPTYIQHENGIRGSGSIPRAAAERYAKFFRVSLDWLLSGKGDEPDLASEPTQADIEQMIREVIEAEVTMQTRLSDLPRIVAPALHEQLERFRSDRARLGQANPSTAHSKGAQSLVATKRV
ncbi:helix-turn-helix domain-containing protein [Sphingomonas sp. Leaf16]|uniref:helix-turn-helix domain-containing protein n=2 Tax=Sphingomonas TaxID=13687 RepID=UPI0012E2ADA4|nr:helix-turn-helix transcriptional regulator [Sphingomonas sp. Leaf16]